VCGIAGWIAYDRDLRSDNSAIAAMTQTMTCRGPDAAGTFTDRHAALGHRRLAIIDLAGGAQPMEVATPSGPVVVAYTGEAYNYRELRAELAGRGHDFRTASDTEVVLRGYLEWGDAVAERLNGMYAFAIWDARTERLCLIRDRMGVKPLFYQPTSAGVLFGSEPKAILAHPFGDRRVDLDGLREMIAFTKRPGHAVWSGLCEVEPGTVVTLDPSGVHTRTYWRLETRPHHDSRPDTVDRVRELLVDTVDRQLVSDVPRCVLLSGGLDSSAITGIAAARLAEQGQRVPTFAVDFTGSGQDFVSDDVRATRDAPYVAAVAEHVGADHRDITLDHNALSDWELRRKVVAARDLPNGLGDMDGSLYLLFRAIREHSTVALSGESADELLGGYKWFHDPAVQQAKTFPWIAARTAAHSVPPELLNRNLLGKLDLWTYINDSYASAVAEVPFVEGESAHERNMRVINYLHLTRFVRVLLDRKDRMSMAVGLEVRVPFCDHRLVEYVYNTPWALKTYDGREKSLLRGASASVIPPAVAERAKSPYPSAQDYHYAAALQQQAKEIAADRANAVHDLLDEQWLASAIATDPATLPPPVRNGLERVLNLAVWLADCRPRLILD
jgi:asparagine synthase (glutamine-hydrolysing)